MSMPLLDDDFKFNFNDINLEFLDSPPRPTNHTVDPIPTQSFNNNEQPQLKVENPKTRNSIQELSNRIAEVDALVRQIRKTEKERDDLQQQLEDFHQSIKEIKTLYANEKKKRMEEKAKNEELALRCQNQDRNLTVKTLEIDQLQAKLDSTKGPIEYNELVIRYLKSAQRSEEQMHWHENVFIKDLQKYCKDKGLKIPNITPIQRSPRKRKTSTIKVDSEIQCNIEAGTAICKQIKQDQSTQYEKITTRSQGCQHIGTTTTRSTTTACFFKYHDVGVNCNLIDYKYALNEMLNEMRTWSAHAEPLSPIADLDENTDELTSDDVALDHFSAPHSKSEVLLPPLSIPQPSIELKTTGTCTYICNVQRQIDYALQLSNIKRSNSRPPSRIMLDTVKNENSSMSNSTHPAILNSINNQMPTIPNLSPSVFNELWQIFGHMIYGILHRRPESDSAFNNQTSAPRNITNQQEFYNWLQTFYLGMESEERTQQFHNPDIRGFNVSRVSTTDTTLEDLRATGNLSDHQIQNHNLASPLNFSNAAPVKCTSSAQYLYKPKAQRTGNSNATDEVLPTDHSEHHSIGTSPLQCTISSPNYPEVNGIKENYFDNSAKTISESSIQNNLENRTPSAFTSPKSAATKDTSKSEISETAEMILELFPTVNNRCKTLESLKKILHKNCRNSRKKSKERHKIKRLSKPLLKTETETAVDFISKLNSFQTNKVVEISTDLKNQLEYKDVQKDQIHKNRNVNRKKKRISRKKVDIRICELFGSHTDSDDKVSCSTPLNNRKEYNEEKQQTTVESSFQMKKESDRKEASNTKEVALGTDETKLIENAKNVIECSNKAENKNLYNCTTFHEKIVQTKFEKRNQDECVRDEQRMLQCSSNEAAYFKSIYHNILTDNAINEKSLPCNIKRELNEKICETNFLSSIDEENKQNKELFLSPKSFSSRNMQNCSPLSDSSTSSTEPKLVIISDNEEMKDLEVMPATPKRRGRKRKITSTLPLCSPTNFSETTTSIVPCKRSARLYAKRLIREEQKTIQQNFSQFVIGKYTKCCNKEAAEPKVEQNNIKEPSADRKKWINSLGLGYYNDFNTENKTYEVKIDNLSKKYEEFLEDANIIKSNLIEKSAKELSEDTTEINTSPNCAAKNENNSIHKITSHFLSPPASPIPFEDVNIDDQHIKEIPLERPAEHFPKYYNKSLLYKLIKSCEPYKYRPVISSQLNKQEKTEVCQIETHFKEYLSVDTQNEDVTMHLVNLVLNISQNLKIIAHAICSSVQIQSRPPTTPYVNLANSEVPLLDRTPPKNIHNKMATVLTQLIQQRTQFTKILLVAIESLLFNVQNADFVPLDVALNLTDLYLLTLTIQNVSFATKNPARLFIAKCLYFYKVKAIPMIYAVLCVFPTTLPHRESDYDRSDALITVIQHILMQTTYDMDNHQLYHREMLSKLRFVYRFEVFKPNYPEVLQNLIEKLRAGKADNLKYAFAIFCKRLTPDRVVRDIIQPYFIPLANEYYSRSQQDTEYDQRTAVLLDCFSCSVKPFPRETTSLLAPEINNYLNIFARFLSVVDRPIIQEAAVHAILRLQRFNYNKCYYALANFRPSYVLEPITQAALRTFIHRKPSGFWKTILKHND